MHNPVRRWRFASLAGALALAIAPLSGGVALAQSVEAEAIEPQAPVLASGGTIDQVRIVTENVAVVLTPAVANSFVNLAGATTTMPVPPGVSRLIIVEFTAETACYGGPAGSTPWCSLRVLIGGAEANPITGTDFAIDSNDALDEGPPSWEGHAMTRSRRYTNTTTVTQNVPIQVQWATTSTTTSLRIDDWHLLVLRSI